MLDKFVWDAGLGEKVPIIFGVATEQDLMASSETLFAHGLLGDVVIYDLGNQPIKDYPSKYRGAL